jgi:UDP-glucose 4-epimerase
MVLNKIGLTGSTGMLGRHVWAALDKARAQVVAVSRAGLLDKNISRWDLGIWLSLTELDDLFKGVQAIVHVGAMVPRTPGQIDEGRMFDANVRACLNLGLWAISRNVPIVHVSGGIVYAATDPVGLTEGAALGWCGQGGFYGLSKLLAEDVFKRLERQGLNLAIVRPTSIYGVGLPADKMISRFLAKAREGGTIELDPPVEDRVDFIHAADVALAITAVLKAEAWDTFNIASKCAVSIRELADACISVMGRGRILINEDSAPMRDPIIRFALNSDWAKSRLGWQPRFDIEQGLGMMLQESYMLISEFEAG